MDIHACEIVEWIDTSNNIERLNLDLHDLKRKHKESTESLLNKMKSLNQNKFKTEEGQIKLETERKVSTLSISKMQELVEEYFEDDPDRYHEFMHFVKCKLKANETCDVLKFYKK